MTKFLAIYDDANGKRQTNIYYSWEIYHEKTFSPECKKIYILDLSRIKGKSYKEKQLNLRNIAIEWSNMQSETSDLSYGELNEISGFFEKYGRRYGLLREFKKEGIC